jgi:hypothetical protein
MTEKQTQTAGTPRWVKVFGIIALALLVLVVVGLIIGKGGHGPGRHAPGGHNGPPAGVTHQQP